MKQKLAAKRYLFASILSLLLSIVLFTGTTYAWFYDAIHNTANRIMTGMLQVDLLHQEGEDWISLKKNPYHAVFDYKEWEPGHAQLESLKLQNVGSLALRYQLLMAVENDSAVLGPDGESIAEAIEMYVCFEKEHGASDIEDVKSSEKWMKMGTLKSVLSQRYVIGGKLFAKGTEQTGLPDEQRGVATEELYMHVLLYMREDVQNGYQHLSAGDITLSLMATQLSFEKDYFGKDYDRIPGSVLYYEDTVEHDVNAVLVLDEESAYNHVLTTVGAGTVANVRGGYYDAANQQGAVLATDASVINIHGGSFAGRGVTATGEAQSLLEASNGAKINIYGGSFQTENNAALLNDNGDHTAITVYAGTFTGWNPANDNGVNHLAAGTALQTTTVGGETVYTVVPVEDAMVKDEGGNLNINADTIVMDAALCQNWQSTSPYTIDGHGHTVTIQAFPDNTFKKWDEGGTMPVMSTLFSTNNNSLLTVKDLTLTGQMNPTFIGHYKRTGDKSAFTSELYHFNIINAQVAPGSNPFAMALIGYGKVTFYDCTMKGSTILPAFEGYPIYDVAMTNDATAYIESGTYIGALYQWEGSRVVVNDGGYVGRVEMRALRTTPGITVNSGGHVGTLEVVDGYNGSYKQRVTINAGAIVDVLDLTRAVDVSLFSIDPAAQVGKIVANGKEYASVADWKAGIPLT